MRIGILAIQQHKSTGAQSIDQGYQADLTCIASPFQRPTEHAFAKESPADSDAIKSAYKCITKPRFNRMRVTSAMEFQINLRKLA